MQKSDSSRGKWQNLVFALIALLVVAADQLSKPWIRSNLAPGESVPETGFFQIIHIQNSGAAFGLFQGQSFAMTIVGLAGTVILLVFALLFYRRFPFGDNRLGMPALGLVLGGTIGNLIDRLCLGYVTDFISIGIWPAFNIADSAIVVGVIIFAYSLLFLTEVKEHDSSV